MRPLAALCLFFAAGCAERSANMKAYDEMRLGRAAHEAGKNAECIAHYDAALAGTKEFSEVHGGPDDWKFWWRQWRFAEAGMARSVCVHDSGRVAAAAADLEASLKKAVEAVGHQTEGLQGSLDGHEKPYIANMNELLAQWKKELKK
jgi:hypothetical protein